MTDQVIGQQLPATITTEYAQLTFVISQMLLRLATAAIVRVVRVTNTGGVEPVGNVDVVPMVSQLTGGGDSIPHGTIYNLPYVRLQGGANAMILDPQVGDIGIAIFANRDISAVKRAKQDAPPGSLRYMDWADGMYVGGLLNGTPTQYVRFSAAGIELHSPVKVLITAPEIDLTATTKVQVTAPEIDVTASGPLNLSGATVAITGPVTMSSTLVATGEVTGAGKHLSTHDHPPGSYTAGGDPVTGTSGAPT